MLDGEFTTLRTVKWRNQTITLKCPPRGHDECNGDLSTTDTPHALCCRNKRR
jgi:hypothetical protein